MACCGHAGRKALQKITQEIFERIETRKRARRLPWPHVLVGGALEHLLYETQERGRSVRLWRRLVALLRFPILPLRLTGQSGCIGCVCRAKIRLVYRLRGLRRRRA